MTNRQKKPRMRVIIAAVSGGPDSVYLLRKLSSDKRNRIVIGHVNYGTRGNDSIKDQELVEKIGKTYGYTTEIFVYNKHSGRGSIGPLGIRKRLPAGFEEEARNVRYRFLRDLSGNVGAKAIALAHTADDQIETILMRVFEGAGIGGLKGIPRETGDGIVRPILDVWKDEILAELKKRRIPYRIDRSNVDTRFERNWVRHVLIPLLEKRYGKSVKKRIFTLGERFRELDDYLEGEAAGWIRRNVKTHKDEVIVFPRKPFSSLPSALRVKILQRICFDRLGVEPNERVLKAMDGNISGGGPSACVSAGKGWKLTNRYEEALFLPAIIGKSMKSERSPPGEKPPILLAAPGKYFIPLGKDGQTVTLNWEAQGRVTPAQAKRLSTKGNAEMFDAAGLALPITVRPLRTGDRIRPFGAGLGENARVAGKKVKEILIDRKIPRGDRWGRIVVCDAEGTILWIPGVLRSALAPVTPATRKAAILRIRSTK